MDLESEMMESHRKNWVWVCVGESCLLCQDDPKSPLCLGGGEGV